MSSDQGVVIDYRALVRRRRWSLIVPACLGLTAGIGLAMTLPREYVASATLAVRSPSLSGGLTSSTAADQAERIRAVSHQLLSQPILEQVARDQGLLDTAPLDDVMADLRSRTTLSVPPKPLSSTGRLEPDTFIVSFTGPTPEMAQRVTNRLTEAFVDANAKLRETRAEDTSEFLARQLELSKEKLSAAEAQLRDAKAAYQGRLPEQALANLQRVTELRQQIESRQLELRTARERYTLLEQQVAGLKQDAQAAAAREAEARTHERLGALEQQLAEARLQYTPRHPEVQRLENDLARARAADEEERRLASPGGVASPADPALRQAMAEREATRLSIADLSASVARAQGELLQYQDLLNGTPAVEQRLLSLTQDYELAKQQHQKLAEQHQAAVLGEDLERRQASERFVVLYPATRPDRPSSPNVPMVVAVAALAGIAAGIALAVAREFLDRSVHDKRTLEETFGRLVLAEIPRI